MRRAANRLVSVGLGFGIWAVPSLALGHGLGGRQDLPVPVEFFVVGAGLVLVFSFVALSVLWPEPRLQKSREGRVIGGRWVVVLWVTCGLIGVIALATVIVSGLLGASNPARNPAPVVVFVGFWLVVPFLSGLIGNVYPLFEPWSRLSRWLGLGESDARVHGTWGYLPAAGVFLAFTWLELVAPDAGPANLAIATLLYSTYLLTTATLVGRAEMVRSFDGFALYNTMFGSMGPLRFERDRLIWRGWIRGLAHIKERRGLVSFVVLMIGTVTYDGMSGSLWWEESITTWSRDGLATGLGWSRTITDTVVGTVALVAVVGLIGGGYWLASSVAARVGGRPHTAASVASRFAHTLVPIAFAYAFAHYFTLVLFEGQFLISTASDPLGLGWDLFATADRRVNYTLLGTTAVWYVQVAVIVAGHVAGVVLAHDRALSDFPSDRAVRSQYAMLGLMVFLTGLGLTILAAG